MVGKTYFCFFFGALSRANAIIEMSYIVAIPNALYTIKMRDRLIWGCIVFGLFIIFAMIGFDNRNIYVFWQ